MSKALKTRDPEFDRLVREAPETFDFEDCRPGPSNYPQVNSENVLPAHVKARIQARRRHREPPAG